MIFLAEIGLDIHRFRKSLSTLLLGWVSVQETMRVLASDTRGKMRKGNVWLCSALVEAAHAAVRSKNTYLCAHYHRLVSRRGKQKALVAVGHTLLVIVYYLLGCVEDYQDLGSNYFDERDRQAIQKRLVRRLENLGYRVVLEPPTPVA